MTAAKDVQHKEEVAHRENKAGVSAQMFVFVNFLHAKMTYLLQSALLLQGVASEVIGMVSGRWRRVLEKVG